jgi:hypothetical protein
MAEEDLIEVIVGNAERGKPFRRAGADIEDELVAVAEFDQPGRAFGMPVPQAVMRISSGPRSSVPGK